MLFSAFVLLGFSGNSMGFTLIPTGICRWDYSPEKYFSNGTNMSDCTSSPFCIISFTSSGLKR